LQDIWVFSHLCIGFGTENDMAKVNPSQFVREVRQEVSKVTWPSRKETGISTVMVMIFVVIAAIFFFLIDQLLSVGVKFLLGLGG
jgi:preprotein translocase subunit SecE